MTEFNCDHESEGFCMFGGSCEYQKYIPHVNVSVCEEYCEQWVQEHTNHSLDEITEMLKEK